MANLKFISTGSTTVTLSGNGLPNSFTANGNAYILGTAISLADGEYVEFAGSTSNFSKDSTHKYQFVIGGTGTVVIEGDLISLVNNNAYVKQYQFFNLFKDCNKITSIANLNFPVSIADWCYANMFMDCTGLVNAGTTLPATVTSRWCYQGMFARCTSLTTPPTILAAKLSPFCYMGMFTGCTSLVSAPSLVNRIVEGDFSTNIMFKGCSNLSTIQVSFTNWPSGGTWSRDWLDGVSNTGVFVHPNTLPVSAIEATSAVPAGWTLSATYPATIIVANQTYSFDAMSDTNQTKVFGFSYDGEETLNIAVDTTNKPAWLSYTQDGDSVDFSANGYSIDSSTTVQIPITFTASDAATKNVVATFSIDNYPTKTITVQTIPTFTFDADSEDSYIISSLLDYATNATSCQIVGNLPTGLSAINGVITGTPTEFNVNYDNNFNIIYSASDARSVASSVNVQIVNAVPDYSAMPLTIQNFGTGNITLGAPSNNSSIEWKLNDGNWEYANGGTVTLAPSSIVQIRKNNGNAVNGSFTTTNNNGGKLHLYGNCNSLINYSSTLPTNAFKELFKGCTGIYSIENMLLPATTLADSCYYNMFSGCSNLNNMNLVLPASTFVNGCYFQMFAYNINYGSVGRMKICGLNSEDTWSTPPLQNFLYKSGAGRTDILEFFEVEFTNWSAMGVYGALIWYWFGDSGYPKYFIKPYNLLLSRNRSYRIPDDSIVLNRQNGVLYYTDSNGNSTTIFDGEDPFPQ